MIPMKNIKKNINKIPTITPTFFKQNFLWMHHIHLIHKWLPVPSLLFCPICTTEVWPWFDKEESRLTQSMDKINMVHPRKILLAESLSSSRFFVSIFFCFSFRPFLRLWIWNYHRWRQGRKCWGQTVGKISWV